MSTKGLSTALVVPYEELKHIGRFGHIGLIGRIGLLVVGWRYRNAGWYPWPLRLLHFSCALERLKGHDRERSGELPEVREKIRLPVGRMETAVYRQVYTID